EVRHVLLMSRHVGSVDIVERPVLSDDHDDVLDGSRRMDSAALIGPATTTIVLVPVGALVALIPLARTRTCGSRQTADDCHQCDRGHCSPDVFHGRLLSVETRSLSTARVVGVAEV